MNKRLFPAVVALAASACQDATAPRQMEPAGTLEAPAAAVAAPSTNLFAVVDINGALVAGNGVLGVDGWFGAYEVTFNQDVSQCAYVATTTNAYSQAMQVFTAGGHVSANGVYVETKNQGGGLTAGPFHLIVSCTNTLPFAVVDYNGNLVRSSGGVSVQNGGGVYLVTFPQSVASCGYLATVADPGSGLVFNPAGVYTGSSATPGTVYIETKNVGGGLQSGVPFHLILVCAGAPKTGYAVVRTAGAFTRGSPAGGSISHPSTGRYTITSPFNISKCAKVLTRGSNNTAVPFNPATVEIGASSTSTQFTAELRQLLFFGGAFLDEAFHTAVVC